MPDTSGRRGAAPWGGLLLLVVLGIMVAGGVGIWWLLGELRSLQAERTDFTQRGTIVSQQLQELERKNAQFTQEFQRLSLDRDNFLEQAKRAIQERDTAEGERQLLDQTFRKTASERLDFQDRLLELEREYDTLLEEQEALLKEQTALQEEVSKYQGRKEEKRLKQALTKVQQERKELLANLRQSQRLAARLKRDQEQADKELQKTQTHLEELQRQYAKLLGDHRALRKEADQVPIDVTKMAREHQRLLKDLTDTHYNMGVLFSRRNDYLRAAQEFHKVVELRPNDPEAHYNLGIIYAEHLPDRQKAIDFFRQYLTSHPRGESANYAKQYIATWQAWEAKERLE